MNDNNYKPLENESHAINIIDKKMCRYVDESMFKLGHLIEGIKCQLVNLSREDLRNNDNKDKRKKWLDEGVEVEVLKVGSLAWQKGKLRVKVTVEFCPDDESNCLDEFREN